MNASVMNTAKVVVRSVKPCSNKEHGAFSHVVVCKVVDENMYLYCYVPTKLTKVGSDGLQKLTLPKVGDSLELRKVSGDGKRWIFWEE